MRQRYEEERRAQNRLAMQNTALNATMWQSIPTINQAVGLITMAALALQAIHGSISIGEVLGFFIMMNQVQWPFVSLSRTWGAMQQAFGAGSRIFAVLEAPTEEEERQSVAYTGEAHADTGSDAAPALETAPALELCDVSFAYPMRDEGNGGSETVGKGGSALFAGLDLTIAKGETVAVVGPSGSGKSTLAQLCCGLLPADRGIIRVNGRELYQDLTDARRQIAYVPQNPYLFTGTILENIGYGLVGATQQEIMDAARLAHADHFIERMERGYDTPLGEQGATLSGGQRQRIAIARAFLRNAPILILDEATSALDNESEQAIQESLAVLMKERTTLLIAHRLSTARNADRIVVLDHGCIVEAGSHEVLLLQDGLYARLYDLQFGAPQAAG